ncbi:MAG: hypothetical protein ACFFER_10730 [Candidatus Thorarchaeota archaeon]
MASERVGIKPTRTSRDYSYFAFVILIVSFLLLSPMIMQWMNTNVITSEYQGLILIRGEVEDWHSGALLLTYEDGFIDRWTIDGYQDYTYLDETHPLYGWISWGRPSRNFTHAETLTLEYHCSGLGMSVGPTTFESDSSQILYANQDLPEAPDGLWITWITSHP